MVVNYLDGLMDLLDSTRASTVLLAVFQAIYNPSDLKLLILLGCLPSDLVSSVDAAMLLVSIAHHRVRDEPYSGSSIDEYVVLQLQSHKT
jgi:hypothetical protein